MTFFTISGFIIGLIVAVRLFCRIGRLERRHHDLSARLSEMEREQAAEEPATAKGTPPPLPKGMPLTPVSRAADQKMFPQASRVVQASSPPRRSFEWRPVLEKMNLWPPSGESAEAALAGWWLTRIGLVLFIIAAVFFGVRISHEVSPWLRVACLGGIAAAVVALGAWLERRLPTFGRILATGGLALGYFTSFAAYALPPTKIIPDTLAAIGVLAQATALAVMLGWSLRKRDEAVAAMGMLLGYVSCWFSWHHDLDHFVIPGLLLLASGGGILLNLRGWLIPQILGAGGSWIGFLLLASFEWRQGGAPFLSLMLGSILILAAVLEAAAFLAAERFRNEPDRWLQRMRRIALLSTSAFLVTGYLATRLAYPDRLSAFYLSAATLLLAFTALRFWRRHPEGLVETYFLKASALIALFLVAEFDGPVRWLSLSGQSLVLLWTYRKSRFLGIEIGFAAVFAAALGAIAYDLWQPNAAGRTVLDVSTVVGALSLGILSSALALHGKWSATKENREYGNRAAPASIDPRPALRIFAAILIGIAAAALVLTRHEASIEFLPPFYLSVLALFLMSPTLLFRQPAPFLAGCAALLFAYLSYYAAHLFPTSNHGSLPIGFWLIALGFGLPAAIQFRWPMDWKCGPFFRATLHGLAVFTVAFTLTRAANDWDLKLPALLLPVFATALAGAAALIAQNYRLRRQPNPDVSIAERLWQWSLAAGIGIATLCAGFATLRNAPFAPVFLLIAATGLIAAAFRTRNAIPGLAGAIPFFAGLVHYLAEFSGKTPMPIHLACAMAMAVVATAIAVVLWKRVDAKKFPAGIPLDAVLHAVSLLVLHWFFRWQLNSAGQVLFAGTATATALFFIARRFPFHSLQTMTLVPAGLALLHAAIASSQAAGEKAWWWAAALLLPIWLQRMAFSHHERSAAGAGIPRMAIACSEALASISLTLIAFRSFEEPWMAVPLGGFGVLLAVQGRQPHFLGLRWWSFLPLALSLLNAISRVRLAPQNGWQTEMLVVVSAALLWIIAHGIAMAWRRRRMRPVAWFHGLAGLGLFFHACAGDTLGIATWSTVCWGGAAIVLFVAGLFASLRPYRLTGLAGLALCLGRAFLVDLEDPLYRIYAFFAMSVVLLTTGYLYYRFRRLIDAGDGEGSDP